MATIHQNLSNYNEQSVPNGASYTIAIVQSEWNEDITKNLAQGAKETLVQNGVEAKKIHHYLVPGAYELPLAAQWLAEKDNVDAVICVGSVIRGETAHFDFVCQAVSQGVKDVGLKTGKPIIFGVLTDDNKQQALDRSGGVHGNKGTEAAITALKMVDLRKKLG